MKAVSASPGSRRAPSRAKAILAGGLCLAAIGLYAWQLGLLDRDPKPRELSADEKDNLAMSREVARQAALRRDVTISGN